MQAHIQVNKHLIAGRMNFGLPADNKRNRNPMSTQGTTSANNNQGQTIPVKDQYALWQIIGIWLAAGAPVWLLSWLVYPALSINLPALEAGILRLKLMMVGLIWQVVLAMIIPYYEEGNIRLSTICRRFWLSHPLSARTGEIKKSLWWWVLPLMLMIAFVEISFKPTLANVWSTIFPFFAEPMIYDLSSMFSPELSAQTNGAWGVLGSILVNQLFNIVLGEEFLFRGVLLPKMEGVFGKWDWVANGVIFGLHHLHQPWNIPSSILTGLIYAFSAKRFRSNWFPIILHSGQSIFLVIVILGLAFGLT